MKVLKICFIGLCLTNINVVSAASFDCAKAKSELEKAICNNPELNATDEKMGEIYKKLSKSFPLSGFVQETQREFLSGYRSCLSISGNGKSSPQAVKDCVNYVQERINELDSYSQAKVYSDAEGKYNAENVAFLTYSLNGKSMLRVWGSWMPDAYKPEPFPKSGFLCNVNVELNPVKNGFQTEETGDSVFKISESALNVSEWIMCNARTGITAGDFKRFK